MKLQKWHQFAPVSLLCTDDFGVFSELKKNLHFTKDLWFGIPSFVTVESFKYFLKEINVLETLHFKFCIWNMLKKWNIAFKFYFWRLDFYVVSCSKQKCKFRNALN